ncbi:PHO85 cyclin-5 [Lecanora helva]
MEQSEDSSACRAMQCGRRMFLAALILASKYLQDRNYSARAWSKISGLRTGEIHNNEMTFLSAVNWKLHIPEPVFHRWTDIVLRYSPSAQVNTFPRSSPVSPLAWKSIIPLLTPDLNTIPSGVGELSRNAGYNSPRSGTHDMSPPPIPVREESYPLPEFEEATPTRPHAISRALEQTPRDMKADERILPPLPHLGSLPTPQLTPQTGTFCTPAVGASGLCPGKSMGHAMAHIQKFSLARSTLDNPHQRRTASSAATPSFVRRPSLASSISSVSSPESMVSDSSSRPSRSSSISSAASNWAVPQSNLLMQVTRQCANQQIRDSKEEELEVKPTATDGDKTTSWFAHRSSVNEPYLKPRTDHAISYESDSQSLCSKRNLQVSTARSSSKELCSKSRAQNVAVDLHTRDRREAAAAAALSDLQLNHAPTSIPAAILPPPKGRKRSRPNSVDLSVQSSVRDMIAPRCLGDITNRSLGGNRKENVVLPDARPASSFLLPKYENARPSSSHSNSKPALSGECLPRKRTCAGSDRGRRDEARLMMQSLKAREGMHAIETLEGIM